MQIYGKYLRLKVKRVYQMNPGTENEGIPPNARLSSGSLAKYSKVESNYKELAPYS